PRARAAGAAGPALLLPRRDQRRVPGGFLEIPRSQGDGMAARELTLSGAPVLMYHGLGAALPAEVAGRETKYWVTPAAFARHLAQIREAGQRVRCLYDFWSGEPD